MSRVSIQYDPYSMATYGKCTIVSLFHGHAIGTSHWRFSKIFGLKERFSFVVEVFRPIFGRNCALRVKSKLPWLECSSVLILRRGGKSDSSQEKGSQRYLKHMYNYYYFMRLELA